MTFLTKYLKTWGRYACNGENFPIKDQLTLRDLSPGHIARVTGFSSRIPSEKRAILRAYGLVPGYPIRIMQHSPVSVIQVEHTEIALEPELAAEIFIVKDS